MAESVVDENELARNVGQHLEDHSSSGRNAKGLNAAQGKGGRRPEVNRVELLANDVEIARVGWPRIHDVKSDALPDPRLELTLSATAATVTPWDAPVAHGPNGATPATAAPR